MPDRPAFDARRRQPWLSERTYQEAAPVAQGIAEHFATHPHGTGATRSQRDMLARLTVANTLWDLLLLRYTAGEPIDEMRSSLERVVEAYEAFALEMRAHQRDPDAATFRFDEPEEYARLMQVVGACFLLHRRDLLPRVASLQDGENDGHVGIDRLFEDLMALTPTPRFEAPQLCQPAPFSSLADALGRADPAIALADVDRFLGRWYADLRGCTWHDTHLLDEDGNQWGYVGYWAFEAGAVVLLLGLDDDTLLHRHAHYPKDLVSWARSHDPSDA